MTSKLVIYSVLAFAIAIAVASVNSNSDVDALYAWKTKLADPNNVLQSWDPTLVNPCFWMHVSCNSENRTTRVDVGNAGLVGTLVPELGNLTYLQYFEVYGNKLNGSIPKEIGKLSRLISLGLQQNQLTGTIPVSFGNLTSLRFLRLSENRLNGLIPATLGNLKSLENIYLNSNNFTGNIPLQLLELVRWGNLRILNISDNSLFGSFQRTNSTGFAVTTIIQDPKAQN